MPAMVLSTTQDLSPPHQPYPPPSPPFTCFLLDRLTSPHPKPLAERHTPTCHCPPLLQQPAQVFLPPNLCCPDLIPTYFHSTLSQRRPLTLRNSWSFNPFTCKSNGSHKFPRSRTEYSRLSLNTFHSMAIFSALHSKDLELHGFQALNPRQRPKYSNLRSKNELYQMLVEYELYIDCGMPCL